MALVPVDGAFQVNVRGALAAILTLPSAAGTKASPQDTVDMFVPMKMVAGTGFGRKLTLPAVAC